MITIPPDIVKAAEDAAKGEVLDCDNCRQVGKHIGIVVLQAIWPLVSGEPARFAAPGPGNASPEEFRREGSWPPAVDFSFDGVNFGLGSENAVAPPGLEPG